MLLNTISFSNSTSTKYTQASPFGEGFIKIFGKGELAAKGTDQKLLIRLNGDNSNSYQGFVHMGGHHGAGEWDDTGFYLGRNGWHLDSTFMFEFTLAIDSNAQKITGSGSSTFALADNRILGYESHSFFVSNPPITSVEVLFTGGVVAGECQYYFYS
ncbi:MULTISPECIES: hypothetical protein [Bacillus amyloliquefaciens group]|uniref:hypothetical protein n=1 Tax=Bacillus amyloliquefaciens group TaxID=1938374 RepID=UPI000A8ECE2B|nr:MULTISPECIES: hypothetical protein [Bacillus amyloliquefaciens group]MBH5315987.1 hypothetical protein [Bacillus velezensis]MDQ1915288.1 hypothetical protein [Bacillus velezensis]QPV74964.1 hypothetical protein I8N72_06135 [Bacillus velezensis]